VSGAEREEMSMSGQTDMDVGRVGRTSTDSR
jgi:hypothetical protein